MADNDVVEQILEAEYRAYLDVMDEHWCRCVALSFDAWLSVWVASA
jgi:hypothetical protein